MIQSWEALSKPRSGGSEGSRHFRVLRHRVRRSSKKPLSAVVAEPQPALVPLKGIGAPHFLVSSKSRPLKERMGAAETPLRQRGFEIASWSSSEKPLNQLCAYGGL
jgi:hypothetical protein